MLQEKMMVADALAGLNASLKTYGDMISQTENLRLRQNLIQLRNSCETSQYELFQIAKENGYYQPAAQAKPEEIEQVKSVFHRE